MDEITQIRRFNRIVTRRAGALNQSYLARGRPLAEARIIHDLGVAGGAAGLQELRDGFGHDSGYMSRLLRSLEKQGMLTVETKPGDARARTVILTHKGETEFTAYDRLSDDLAGEILKPLNEERRKRLVLAMAEVENLLTASSVSIAPEPADSKDALWCMQQYFDELAARFDIPFDPEDPELWKVADMLVPAGQFLIARLDGRPVGCGGLRRFDDTAGEIKRVWVSKQVRGMGVAGRFMDMLETQARQDGYSRLLLDTNGTLNEARAMYAKRGYREIGRYNDNPHAQHWFELALG